MTKPIAVELFCGVGGMSLGFEQAGFNIVAAFDLDPINVEYHKKNFPRTQTFKEDVATLSAESIREKASLGDRTIDVLFGGPPCQGFSEIGQRRNGDVRNQLIVEFARLVAELRPRYFVVENVRGLLYGYSKATLQAFLTKVRSAGYEVVEPIRVLDATEHGVPQKRKRAFILGHRKRLPAPKYPNPLRKKGDAVTTPAVMDAIGDLPSVGDHECLLTSDVFEGKLGKPSEYARILRGELKARGDHSYRRQFTNGVLGGCLRTVHGTETVKRFAATPPGTYEVKSRCYRLKADGAAYTLRAGTLPAQGSFTAARPIHPVEARCITTREAARLHSFPDWFQFHPTKWHGFRQVGNAVPPTLARAVARTVLTAVEKADRIPQGRR